MDPNQAQVDLCSICLDQLDADLLPLPSCSHTFHTECINGWLAQNANNGQEAIKCPLCRTQSSKAAIEEIQKPFQVKDILLLPFMLIILAVEELPGVVTWLYSTVLYFLAATYHKVRSFFAVLLPSLLAFPGHLLRSLLTSLLSLWLTLHDFGSQILTFLGSSLSTLLGGLKQVGGVVWSYLISFLFALGGHLKSSLQSLQQVLLGVLGYTLHYGSQLKNFLVAQLLSLYRCLASLNSQVLTQLRILLGMMSSVVYQVFTAVTSYLTQFFAGVHRVLSTVFTILTAYTTQLVIGTKNLMILLFTKLASYVRQSVAALGDLLLSLKGKVLHAYGLVAYFADAYILTPLSQLIQAVFKEFRVLCYVIGKRLTSAWDHLVSAGKKVMYHLSTICLALATRLQALLNFLFLHLGAVLLKIKQTALWLWFSLSMVFASLQEKSINFIKRCYSAVAFVIQAALYQFNVEVIQRAKKVLSLAVGEIRSVITSLVNTVVAICLHPRFQEFFSILGDLVTRIMSWTVHSFMDLVPAVFNHAKRMVIITVAMGAHYARSLYHALSAGCTVVATWMYSHFPALIDALVSMYRPIRNFIYPYVVKLSVLALGGYKLFLIALSNVIDFGVYAFAKLKLVLHYAMGQVIHVLSTFSGLMNKLLVFFRSGFASILSGLSNLLTNAWHLLVYYGFQFITACKYALYQISKVFIRTKNIIWGFLSNVFGTTISFISNFATHTLHYLSVFLNKTKDLTILAAQHLYQLVLLASEKLFHVYLFAVNIFWTIPVTHIIGVWYRFMFWWSQPSTFFVVMKAKIQQAYAAGKALAISLKNQFLNSPLGALFIYTKDRIGQLLEPVKALMIGLKDLAVANFNSLKASLIGLRDSAKAFILGLRDSIKTAFFGFRDSLKARYADFKATLVYLKTNLMPILLSMKTSILETAQSSLASLLAWKANFVALKDQLKAQMVSGFNSSKLMLVSLKDNATRIRSEVTERIKQTVATMKANFQGWKDMLNSYKAHLMQTVNAWRDSIKNNFNALKAQLNPIKENVMTTFNGLKQQFNQMKESIKQQFNSAKQQFNGLKESIKQLMIGYRELMKQQVMSVKLKLKETKDRIMMLYQQLKMEMKTRMDYAKGQLQALRG